MWDYDTTDNTGAWPADQPVPIKCKQDYPEDDFYMIVCDSGTPVGNKQYRNRTEAIAKAELLAADQPGKRVYLLKVETSCVVVKTPALWRTP